MNYAGGISSYNYTDACASPLYIGEISVFLIYRRMYFAVVHRRDTSLPYKQTHLPRRWTSARYQSFSYSDACTSPLYIGEISVFLIYRRMYFAVVHRRGLGSMLENLLNNTSWRILSRSIYWNSHIICVCLITVPKRRISYITII